jgi:hypothetical protein
MNFHGCALQAEGDILPASNILSIFSLSTGTSIYFLSLCRPAINSSISFPLVISLDISYQN